MFGNNNKQLKELITHLQSGQTIQHNNHTIGYNEYNFKYYTTSSTERFESLSLSECISKTK